MLLKEITKYLESCFPLSLQEDYDNSGLQTGASDMEVTGALLTIDVTEAIIDEAIQKKANLIISHHPLIFKRLKRITGQNYVERALLKAIRNNIALYAIHTNADSIIGGVNSRICTKLGLKNVQILSHAQHFLRKLVVFVPSVNADSVREALCNAGAGHIGNYDFCTYNTDGRGSFRAGENTNPVVGEKGKIHFENEVRIETIFPHYLQKRIVDAMLKVHPYEEVAFDIYPLENEYPIAGMGMTGELENETPSNEFLNSMVEIFSSGSVRYTRIIKNKIKKVAVCGGAGSNLIHDAINSCADIYVTSDIKYHDFFDADGKIIIADIGHYESEQFTKEIFYDLLIKKFPKFALHLSAINTNPINYL